MSFKVFFGLSSGLSKTIHAPKGTLASIRAHVAEIEKTLSLKTTRYEKNPPHWDHWDAEYRNGWPSVEDEVLCKAISKHNRWVRGLYGSIQEWSKTPVKAGDKITPKVAASFWHALTLLEVKPPRWTREYYVERMEALYEVMRGRETEGVSFDERPLTPKQAGAVIVLFDQYLDGHDMRLAVPVDHDRLASSYDGGYTWCETHGAIAESDLDAHAYKRCELAKELRADKKG